MNRLLISKLVILALVLCIAFFNFVPSSLFTAGGDDLIDIIEPRSVEPPKYVADPGDLIDIIEPRSIIIEYLA